MSNLIERLRALSRHEHDDLSIGEEAADEIERLRIGLARHVDRVCELTTERDALRAKIDGAMVVKATRNGIVRSEARMALIGKRVALVVLNG